MITRTYETLDKKELRRNIVTMRLRDNEHSAISDEAWKNRMSVSAWLRKQALEKLAKEGILLN